MEEALQQENMLTVEEGENGVIWGRNFGALPPNVHYVIASGGLETWVKKQIRGP